MTSLILPRAAGWPRAGEARISAFGRQLGCRTLLLPTAAGWADAAGILARTGGVGNLETAPVGGVLSRRSSISSVWSDYLQDRGYLDPAEGYWWVFRSRLTAVAGNWGGILARTQDNSTASGWAWQRTNSDQLYVYHGGSNWYLGVSMSSLVDGEDHVLLGLWRKAESRLELWRDGKLFAAANGITTAPPYAAGQGQIKILASRDTANLVGSASFAAVGVGNLSAGAAAAISGDVGLLFARRRQVLYFDAGGASGIVIDAGVGDAAAAGAPAGIIASTVIAAQVGGAAAAGLPADIQHAVAIQATVGDAAAAGSPAAISQGTTVAAGIGNAEASGLPASLSTGSAVEASTGDAQAAGLTAGISAATAIAATVGDAEAAGVPAAISQGVVIVAGIGSASASGRPANIAQAITITTTAGNAAAAALTAAIEAAGGEIACLVGDAEARGLVAGIAAGVTVRASVGAALASGLPASVSTGAAIHAQVGAAMAAALKARVVAPVTIFCGHGDAEAAGLNCLIDTATHLVPTPGYTIALGSRAWSVGDRARTWRIQ